MKKRWIYTPLPDETILQNVQESINVSKIPATLLLQRGIDSFEAAKAFFRPDLAELHDPFLMKGMDIAVSRLQEAIKKQEKILIYGDYDVDGTTSVALLYSFIKKINSNVFYYIPDRHKEGYGVSFDGIDFAKNHQITFIISLDCGVKAKEQVAYAKSLHIDFVICDHHLPDAENMPDALAMLNPKQTDCPYPFKELSGCGIGFKYLQGYCQKAGIELKKLYGYLDLVGVSIAADIVPMHGENRILAYFGLLKLNKKPLLCFQKLIQVAALHAPLNIRDVVFGIAPRINAAGRLTDAYEALKLLICEDEKEAFELARKLNVRNTERREIEKQMTQEALAMVADNFPDTKSIVLFQEDWHKGLVGIVAARCVDRFYRPSIILTESKGEAAGSARSVKQFSIYKALEAASEPLTQFGGHDFAAGMTLPLENVALFREKFEQVVSQQITDELLTPAVRVDMCIELENITAKNFRILEQFAPFGPHNMRPVFAAQGVKISQIRILKEKHLKCSVQQGARKMTAIAFGMAHYQELIQSKETVDIAFVLSENHYKGRVSLQMELKDIR